MTATKRLYSQKFTRRLKAVFPNSERLNEALRNRDREGVKSFLRSVNNSAVGNETIIELISEGRIEELRQRAQRLVDIHELYLNEDRARSK